MSHDPIRFDAWFAACYERLRRYLGPDGLDEDTFHDTYLLIREKARNPELDILDFGAYFCGCYRRISLHKRCTPQRSIHSEEDFFLRLGNEGPAVPEEELGACDRLVQDILEFVRRNFSYENTAFSLYAITKPAGISFIGRWPNIRVRLLPKSPASCGPSCRPCAGTAASHCAVTCLPPRLRKRLMRRMPESIEMNRRI